MRPAPGKRQYVSLGPPDKFERVHDAALDDYPPGQYVVSEGEEWINARATADASSPIVAQRVRGLADWPGTRLVWYKVRPLHGGCTQVRRVCRQ